MTWIRNILDVLIIRANLPTINEQKIELTKAFSFWPSPDKRIGQNVYDIRYTQFYFNSYIYKLRYEWKQGQIVHKQRKSRKESWESRIKTQDKKR